MALSPAPTLCRATKDFGLVRWKHVLVLFWRGIPSLEGLSTTARELDRILGEHPKAGMVFVLEAKTVVPSTDIVREAVRLFKHYGLRIGFRVGLVEVEGMGGDLMRAVVRTVITLVPSADSSFCADLRSTGKAIGQHLSMPAMDGQSLVELSRGLYDRALGLGPRDAGRVPF